MYTHILIPTDGSALSLKAAREGALLARKLGARITALYVYPPYSPPYAGEGLFFNSSFSQKQYMDGMRTLADKILARVSAIARKQNVSCAEESIVSDTPWEGIIKGASKLKCDLIAMASHGRGGIAGVVLGSQTTRVLTHSKTPVLVCR